MANILVVEDEPEMADILKLILEGAGHSVSLAHNGSECISMVEKGRFDLIMMDIRMPKINGWEALRKMKEGKLLNEAKIIMVTIEKGPGVEIFGLQDIVADYITKPFDKDDLLRIVKNVLKK